MNERINYIKSGLKVTNMVINQIGDLYDGSTEAEVGMVQLVNLDLLQKISANLEVMTDILDRINDNYNQKIPLALLIRTCLTDSMIGVYLLCHGEEEYMEELDVLNLGFVKYLKTMLPLEIEFFNYINNESHLCEQQFDERYERYEKYLRSIKGEDWKVKSASSFRESGDNTPLTVDKMIFYIKKKGEDKGIPILVQLSYMYNLYRYFSQYEHYTFIGRHIVKQSFEDELRYIITALIYIVTSVQYMTSVLDKCTTEMRSALDNVLDTNH